LTGPRVYETYSSPPTPTSRAARNIALRLSLAAALLAGVRVVEGKGNARKEGKQWGGRIEREAPRHGEM
jgi:hypothetical protein